jgi:malate dehydrogenase (quinone)
VHFGTEVVTTEDKTISALLGASPGASVCVNIVLEVAQKCLPGICNKAENKKKLKEMIPTYDIKLKEFSNLTDVEQYKLWSERAEESLGLKDK